jgi:hypothetical protein
VDALNAIIHNIDTKLENHAKRHTKTSRTGEETCQEETRREVGRCLRQAAV